LTRSGKSAAQDFVSLNWGQENGREFFSKPTGFKRINDVIANRKLQNTMRGISLVDKSFGINGADWIIVECGLR
jgi:hypothetical protein